MWEIVAQREPHSPGDQERARFEEGCEMAKAMVQKPPGLSASHSWMPEPAPTIDGQHTPFFGPTKTTLAKRPLLRGRLPPYLGQKGKSLDGVLGSIQAAWGVSRIFSRDEKKIFLPLIRSRQIVPWRSCGMYSGSGQRNAGQGQNLPGGNGHGSCQNDVSNSWSV
jgi:hypothetical protein